MRVITASEPLVVRCPRCYDRLLLHHAELPDYLDLAASMAGQIVDAGDPTGVQVALALHVRGCQRQDPDSDTPDTPPEEEPV